MNYKKFIFLYIFFSSTLFAAQGKKEDLTIDDLKVMCREQHLSIQNDYKLIHELSADRIELYAKIEKLQRQLGDEQTNNKIKSILRISLLCSAIPFGLQTYFHRSDYVKNKKWLLDQKIKKIKEDPVLTQEEKEKQVKEALKFVNRYWPTTKSDFFLNSIMLLYWPWFFKLMLFDYA